MTVVSKVDEAVESYIRTLVFHFSYSPEGVKTLVARNIRAAVYSLLDAGVIQPAPADVEHGSLTIGNVQ